MPPNGKVNFEGNGFILKFDEYIRTSGLQKELIVTPPLEEPPETFVKGKELHVEWKEALEPDQTLKPDQTYSFRFGNSVEDITEGNATEDLVYAFSTGPHLDSLHFEGRVVDARSMEGVEDVLAILYKKRSHSVPRTQRPYYFSRTDEKGHFDIPFLAEGSYKFFALKDKNRNQIFDLPNERIGFIEEPVRPYSADSSKDLVVRLFQEEREDQYLSSRKVEPGRLFLKFGRPADSVQLRALGQENFPWSHVKEHSETSDSAFFWFTEEKMPDSIDVVLKVDGRVLDTLMIRNMSGLEDGVELEMDFQDPLDYHEMAAFEAAHPLHDFHPDSMIGVSDSDTVALNPRIGGPASRQLILEPERGGLGESLDLTLLPGAVQDTFRRVNRDTLRFSFGIREEDHYGKLSVFLEQKEGKEEPVLLNLLDKKGRVLRERRGHTGEWFRFPYLSPGPIRIELIRDLIPNARWDPGRYPDRQPEPVLYYPDTVKVRSNWEREIEWKGIGGN